MSDRPPDDAYGRVTNPERFRLVHDAADAIVARLESKYQVERRDDDNFGYEGVVRQVMLLPSAGAPLTVSWDTFPGVRVRYGRWHDESYPQCGCDACNEDPEELIAELERKVEAVVAGHFTEGVMSDDEGTWLTYGFVCGDRRARGKARLLEGHPLRNEPGQIIWPAWPLQDPARNEGPIA